MRVLVTGGSGFLGSHIVDGLLQRGYKVRSMARNPQVLLPMKGVECVQGDIIALEDVERALEGVDAVFHTAAHASVDMLYSNYYHTNVIGTKNLINVSKKVGVSRFVYTSSPAVVFNGDNFSGADESVPVNTKYHWYYAKTKAIAENYVLHNNSESMKTTAIRPHLLLGAGDNHLLPTILQRARKHKLKIIGDGTNLVDVTFVENAALAHLLAFENINTAAGKAYFIGQERPVNLWEFVNFLCQKLRVPLVTDYVSFKSAYRFGWLLEKFYQLCSSKRQPPMTRALAVALAKDHYFSHERARIELGYKPQFSIEMGIVDLLNNLRRYL